MQHLVIINNNNNNNNNNSMMSSTTRTKKNYSDALVTASVGSEQDLLVIWLAFVIENNF